MSEVPERGRPETRTNVLPDFSSAGFGSGRSLSKIASRSSRFGISGRSKSLFALRIRWRRSARRGAASVEGLRCDGIAAFSRIAAFALDEWSRDNDAHLPFRAENAARFQKRALARSFSPERASATPRLKCASGRRCSRLTARKRAVDRLLVVAESPINGRKP